MLTESRFAASSAEVVGCGTSALSASPAPTSRPRGRPPRRTLMYHPEFPITPTQQAANGALGMFVDGHQGDDIPQMLVGLSVLQSATVDQVHIAMRLVQAGGGATVAEIEAMLAA